MIGDVIRINEKEYRLVAIDDGVVTLERGDEIRYYSFYDITWDIMDGYWVSSICEQVFSPTVKRKLKVYEVQQDNVYLYNSLEELNDEQVQGYNAMQGIATGKVTNLQEAVQRIEEAELSLKLALEVKNKAINAYKEITRMQI